MTDKEKAEYLEDGGRDGLRGAAVKPDRRNPAARDRRTLERRASRRGVTKRHDDDLYEPKRLRGRPRPGAGQE